MLLEEFFDYKNQLMEDLLTEPAIVRLLQDEPPEDDVNLDPGARDLMYKQVFPYEYIPETVEHGRTYICADVDIEETENKTFLRAKLMIWVFTHSSLMRLPQGGVRVDKLCSEIDKKINGSRVYGLGELNFSSTKRFAIMTDYNGKVMTFYTKDFNRLSGLGPPKPRPANRKHGL